MIVAPTNVRMGPGAPPAVGLHAYFDSLVARPDHWKSYSLRDAAQIALYRQGSTPWVDYIFATDPDPRKQDAAKIIIPDFVWRGQVLLAPLSATDTTFETPPGLTQAGQMSYRIDGEVMTFVSRTTTPPTTTVIRGQHGTAAVAHTAGDQIYASVNSLLSQVRLPMGTSDGHSYVIVWDVWFGAEFKYTNTAISNYKTFQFDSPRQVGGQGNIWMEIDNSWISAPTDAGLIKGRYNTSTLTPPGPGVSISPLGPQVGSFVVTPETWTRYIAKFDQKVAGDAWTRYSLWATDATRPPVLIFDQLPVTVLGGIQKFWLEYNTSTNALAPNRGPLVSYVRHVWMGQDVVDMSGILVQP